MSHFSVLVIGGKIEEQLAPYNENLEVPEYDRGPVTLDDKDRFKDYYVREYGLDKNLSSAEFFDQYYPIHGESWDGGRCKKVDGVWREFSTYNPKSKWDWYCEGGRWSDLNALTQEEMLQPENFFTVVRDGIWYERGRMGWFGMSWDEKSDEEWDELFKNLIKGADEFTVIDCHI